MGWLTTEELYWNADGQLMTHAPSTYKIPACSDVPEDFRVRLLQSGINREDTIFRSKAVGGPPLMPRISVFHALKDSVASVAGYLAQSAARRPGDPRAGAAGDRGAAHAAARGGCRQELDGRGPSPRHRHTAIDPEVIAALIEKRRPLGAMEDGELVGTVTLHLDCPPNQRTAARSPS